MSESRGARFVPLVAGALALAAAGPASAQTWRTLTSARQLWDREPVSVQIEYGAGDLKVRPADRAMLYQMEMRYDEQHFTPLTAFDAKSRTLQLGMRGRDDRKGADVKGGARADIKLSRDVPLDLQLQFGAGDADIDLNGVQLRRLNLSTGASETTVHFDAPNPIAAEEVRIRSGAAELKVLNLGNTRAQRFDFQGGVGSTTLDFGGKWNRDASATVQMGIGAVVMRFPRALGVRINKSSLLTSFDAPGLQKRDGSYFSSNWDAAPHKLTVDVDAAFGSIAVEWID